MTSLTHFLFMFLFSLGSWAAVPAEIAGEALNQKSPVKIAIQSPEKTPLVVSFLSAKCPCSNSHIAELKALAEKYPKVRFVAIHSNIDEEADLAGKYFTSLALPFPVVQDEKAKIADEFKAFKTPHVFIVSPEGEILYQGGMTDSANCATAKTHYLAEALEDLSQHRKIKVSETRTLGCVILRQKNTW